MKKNIFSQSIKYLNTILDEKQKTTAYSLLGIMFIGMTFEILLLNNLMILLNYLTNSNIDTPKIVSFLENYLNFGNSSILVLMIFIFTFLMKTTSNIFVKWKESKFLYQSKAQISEKLFIGYLKLPFIYHQRTNSAQVIRNITTEIEQFSIFLFSISKLILEFLVLLGISVYLIFFDFVISTTCITLFILFGYFFNYFNKKKIVIMGSNRLTHQNERMRNLIEAISGVRELKLSARYESIVKNFNYHNDSIANISISTSLRNAFSKPSLEIFMLILLSISLFYLIFNNLLSASLIPIIGIYLAAAYRLVPSIAVIVQSIQSIQFNIKSVKNLKDDIEKFKLNQIKNKNKKDKIIFNEKINLKNLYFSYDLQEFNSKNYLFNGCDLEIRKGDFVGIQGESGSGKSTLLDLLIGLQTPTNGEVIVDGANIKQNLESWQNMIGCVPQEVFISDDTLKKNIAFGLTEENISEEKIIKSLQFSNLKIFSENLEKGINTVIGEKGSRISGGQKQRIGIARAIYNNPEIIIFDEATSSLDPETENKIIDEINLLKRNKTIIIVSHKSSLFKNCDYIYKLENKKITKVTN